MNLKSEFRLFLRQDRDDSFVFVLFPLLHRPCLHGECVNGLHFLLERGVDQLMPILEGHTVEFVRDNYGVPFSAASVGQVLQMQVDRGEGCGQFILYVFARCHRLCLFEEAINNCGMLVICFGSALNENEEVNILRKNIYTKILLASKVISAIKTVKTIKSKWNMHV